MNQPVKTSKNPYLILASGFGLGAVCMFGLFNSAESNPAYAQLGGTPSRTISATSAESVTELHNLDTSYINLAEFVAPAVVDIHSTNNSRHMGTNGERIPISGGEGSGFIFRPDGYIITNDHVVGGYDEVKVTLKDGRDYDGKVIRSEDSDIAIVKIQAKDLPTLALSDSSRVRTGQTVMAIGAPFGLQQSVTFGHVSALGRQSSIENKLYPDLIQTDASINMGNSGGPLVNIEGQVVGVNTSILSPSGASAGIGFAIPSNQIRFIAEMLVNKGKVTRSMIGLIPVNLKDYQKKDMNLPNGGALVDNVPSDGPAGAAGIHKGDIIVKVGTTPITNELDLRNAMLVYAPNTTVPVVIVRDGHRQTIDVKLTAYKRPPAPKQVSPFDGGQGFTFPKGSDPFKDMPGFQLPKGFDDNGLGGNGPDDSNGSDKGSNTTHQGKPRLGVGVGDATPDAKSQYNIPDNITGAVVGSVTPNSVASRIGLQAGDVITSFGSKSIGSAEELTSEMQNVKWGDSRTIKVMRFGKGFQSTKVIDVHFN